MNVLICGSKALNISGISDAISPRYIRKNPRNMHARVLHMMAQFVLKIENFSHIIGTTPVPQIARLRSRSLIMTSGKTSIYWKAVISV